MGVIAPRQASFLLVFFLNMLNDAVRASLPKLFERQSAYRIMHILRDRSWRAARMNVVLGELMAERLSSLGIARDNIRVIPNFADGGLIRTVPHADNDLRKAWGLEGKFVAGYSATWVVLTNTRRCWRRSPPPRRTLNGSGCWLRPNPLAFDRRRSLVRGPSPRG